MLYCQWNVKQLRAITTLSARTRKKMSNLHFHKTVDRSRKSQTRTKQATGAYKTMQNKAKQCKVEQSRAEQLLKIFCPFLNELNRN